MTSKELLYCLLDSSSLRSDLLQQIERVLLDILNNIKLTDELCARVSDESFDFIKGWFIKRWLENESKN